MAESPSYATFGEVLRYLRRRARLTQAQLGARVSYTESHICRLERNQRLPDEATLAALFVPALRLQSEPQLAARLLELAAEARSAAWLNRRPAPEPAGLPAPPAFAVDRGDLMARLRSELEREGGVAICGLAGMGKTTLAAALARELAGRLTVVWVILREGIAAPSEVVIRQLAGVLDRQALLDTQPLPLDRQLHVVAGALAERPVLLCLDNVHLAAGDEALRAVVRRLAETSPCRVLLTSREQIAWPPLPVVRVAGLDMREARELVGHAAPELAPAVVSRLVERTAGSPMLLRLACSHLRQEREPDRPALVETVATQPEVAEYLLDGVLGRLSPDARRLAELLAVVDRPVDLHDAGLVGLVAGRGPVPDWLAAVRELQRRLLVDHPARALLHPLVRDQLAAGLTGDEPLRRRLHRAAARWFEEGAAEPLAAARHRLRAGDVAQAAEVLSAGVPTMLGRGEGAAAAELGALVEARLAVRRPPPADELYRLRIARAELMRRTGRLLEAEAAYRLALEPVARAEAAWRLAECLLQRGQVPEALDLCQVTVRRLAPESELIRAQLASVAARALLMASRHDEALGEARRALDAVSRLHGLAPAVTGESEARARGVIGVVLRLRGDGRAARQEMGLGLDAATRAGLGELAFRIRFNLASLDMDAGELAAGIARIRSLQADAELTGDDYMLGRVLHSLSGALFQQGNLDAAFETSARACALKERVGDRSGLASTLNQRAEIFLAVGDVEEARRAIRGSLEERVADRWIRSLILDTAGCVELVAGDGQEAIRLLEEALDLAVDLGAEGQQRYVRLSMAVAHLAGGRIPDALAAADAALAPTAPPRLFLVRRFLDGAIALLRGRTVEALREAVAMAGEAERHDLGLLRLAAGHLAAACARPIVAAELPRLLLAPADPRLLAGAVDRAG
jgi:tetratricopeptide (TPR) repeat protein/transcriptional regulator with XRE-family HTH domain